MKQTILRLLLPSLLLLGLWSCKKDENRIFLEAGTPPVLTASTAGPLVLTRPDATSPAVRLSWTNPNYRFTTGISSQDVTYLIQVDKAGQNFASADRQEISVSKDLGVNWTVADLNGILTRMNLPENVAHDLEIRVRASMANETAPLFSNVVKLRVTPYLDIAVPLPPTGELYITGNAMPSDWTNSPPATQKFTKLSNTEYTITVPLTSGKFYKFLSTPGQWQPQYGGKDAGGGDLGANMGGGSDPDAIPTPADNGTYKITVNFKTGKYTVVKQ